MPRENIIQYSTTGVDLRRNPLDLGNVRFHSAKNIAFDENSIKTRPGFRYHKLGIRGKWQGGTYFSPSTGLSSENYSGLPNGLINVVDGKAYVTSLGKDGIGRTNEIGSIGNTSDPVFAYDAEQYLILHVEKGSTYWSDQGLRLESSPGLSECADDHDTLDDTKIKNWVPCGASVGAYVHGRLHVAIPFSCNNTEIAVGDLITKRGCKCQKDLLHFTEHCNLSHGGGLSGPSRFGPTQSLIVMPSKNANGEGELFDFRKSGILRHNTLLDGRESRYDASGQRISEGWDTRRISHVQINTFGAVGRYATYQLPNDIMFRSRHGIHFLKTILGEGTFNDDTTSVISQDVEPLLKEDADKLEGASVGHWLFGNRFFATVKHVENEWTSQTSGTSFVSFNQAQAFTEDRTPRFVTEGEWKPDDGITNIHMFTQAGECLNGDRFGFICSDSQGELYFAEIDKKLDKGVDKRDGLDYPIEWELETGTFRFLDFKSRKEVVNGFIDGIVETDTKIQSYIKTDESIEWQDWGKVESCGSKALLSGFELNRGEEGTLFNFKFEGENYIELRNVDVEFIKTDSKTDAKGRCIPLK